MDYMGWSVFGIFIVVALFVDLTAHKDDKPLTRQQAMFWSLLWVACSLTFNGYIWIHSGPDKALEFFTAYIVEKSLSLDNLFVFYLIFKAFEVHPTHQHRVLFWGILGAFFFRAALIALGVELVQTLHWMSYLFGAILIYTAYSMLQHRNDEEIADPLPLRLLRPYLPLSENPPEGQFFHDTKGRWHITPLFLALLTIEVSDVIFAFDSIPAVLGISQDLLIVYTSNAFAILGLRALYFLLVDFLKSSPHLHVGLSIILGFIGFKFFVQDFLHIPTWVSLGVIMVTLTTTCFWNRHPD
ncbi:MAG: TerC/Alx family metal homeostasis membrane protein [bacterium]|nr:TerC/Alx family metal homeostasis membrane protein [bacterium]